MLAANELFSVYNIKGINDKFAHQHQLADLSINQDVGWGVSRNPLKPLNHLGFLKRKEEIAERLLLHNIKTPSAIFDRNYVRLEQHQRRQLSLDVVIDLLAQELNALARPLPQTKIRQLLQEFATVRHMEFHPSDVCNLTCLGCTYGHDDPVTKPLPINFPFEQIHRISALQPSSMVIIGGGEPTLYRMGKYRFQELIDEITGLNPGITLALTTNGTFKPKGDWPNKFDWIRLSLDAASLATYAAFRGKPQFDQVIANFLDSIYYPQIWVTAL